MELTKIKYVYFNEDNVYTGPAWKVRTEEEEKYFSNETEALEYADCYNILEMSFMFIIDGNHYKEKYKNEN